MKPLEYLTVCLILLAASGVAIAQSTDAAITGLVDDPAKASIPHAKVTAINIDTSVRTSTETNDQGAYSIPGLLPGSYRVEVEKAGFKTIIDAGLILHVQDNLELNFHMALGSLSESVSVEASAVNINTADASVSTLVDRNFAENLPMNGRSFQTLINLAPGVVVTGANVADSGQFSVNGQRAVSNYWMVDGVSANIGIGAITPGNGFGGTLGSFSALGGTNSLVSVDAMQEFRIQTSTYAPEFGRMPGGQISILTRSGTNQFHGTAFDYLRNDALDANDWFANSVGQPRPEERQNDFGGTFGGPILKDRTFFFFSYEGLQLRLPGVALTTVPDLNSRQNALPALQPYLNAYPLPNGPEVFAACNPASDSTCPSTGMKPTGTAQFNASYSNSSSLNAYSLRIDHKLSDAISLFGRYNYSPSSIFQRGGNLDALSVVTPLDVNVQTGTAGMTWFISSRTANELRFNYSRTDSSTRSYSDNFGGAVPLAAFPFPAPFSADNAVLAFEVSSLTSGAQLRVGGSEDNTQRQINVTDTLSTQIGSHALKMGVDFRRLSPTTAPAQYLQSAYFSSMDQAEIGSPFSAYILESAGGTFLFRNLGVFAQDTWRVNPRLTLTYGLRWDTDFTPSSLSGPSIPAVTGYDLTNLSGLGIAPAGTPPFATTYGNIAPRIGIAYQARQSQQWATVVRGGFGVFYDVASSQTGSLISSAPPFGVFSDLGTASFPFSPENAAAPVIPSTGSLSQLAAFNPHLKLPYTLEWNVAVEQALGGGQSLTVSYVGAAGRRLLQSTDIYSPGSTSGVESGAFIDNTATSDYDALQVQFQRRLSRGLQILSSYVWAHSIDTASAGSPQVFSNAGVPGSTSNANRGPSDFDIRHTFSLASTYAIPVPETVTGFRGALLRGWSLQNNVIVRSAPPVDISDGNFFLLAGGVEADVRPDLVPGQALYLYGSQYPGGKALNSAAFTDPPASAGTPLRQGNVPRNFLRGFGATQWDLSLHRDFPIRESVRLQFRAEMFNVLNHPTFGQPANYWGYGGFGLSSQTLGNSLAGYNSVGGGAFDPLYQIGGPRSIQLALKLAF